MPKTRTLLWLAILCFSPDYLCGCTCVSVPSFIENIHKETRVFQVEVLAHGALPVNDIRQFLTKKYTSKEPAQSVNALAAPLLPYSYTSYTLLKIIDPIMGESSIGDTIVFFNGESSLCLGSLENRAPGTKYVLKVSESNEEALGNDAKSYLKKNGLLDKNLDTGNIYTSEICHEWILKVEDQMFGAFRCITFYKHHIRLGFVYTPDKMIAGLFSHNSACIKLHDAFYQIIRHGLV